MENKNKKLNKTLLLIGFASVLISSNSIAQVTTTTPSQAGSTTQSFLGGTVTTTMPNYGTNNNVNNINSNQTQGKIANTLQNKVDTMSQPNYASSTNTIDPSVLVLADKFHGDLYTKYSLEGYEKSLHNPGDFYNTYTIDYYTNYKKNK